MSNDGHNNDGHEGFLARWSRRKRSGEADAAPKVTAKSEPSNNAKAVDADRNAPAEPAFDLSKLPRIEDLTPTSDFAQFLQKGVPDDLKRLALRRAWSLDPAIANFVEVAENQYDWNVVGGVPGFGDLDAGVDLKALLLQATGQLPEPRERVAETPAADAVDQQSAPDSAAETVDAVPATGASAQVGAQPAEPTPMGPAPHSADLAKAAVAPRRARHGGALAGIDAIDT